MDHTEWSVEVEAEVEGGPTEGQMCDMVDGLVAYHAAGLGGRGDRFSALFTLSCPDLSVATRTGLTVFTQALESAGLSHATLARLVVMPMEELE